MSTFIIVINILIIIYCLKTALKNNLLNICYRKESHYGYYQLKTNQSPYRK